MKQRDSTYPIHIYVLELEDGYYYVGKTEHPQWRLRQHIRGKGAEWTKSHSVVRCLKWDVYYVETEYDEDRHENQTTIQWMHRMGWQKVRGGLWCELSEGKTLNKLHKYGHFRELKLIEQELQSQTMNLYILELKSGKYFVGHARDLKRTLRKHEYGKGPEWTKKYRPVGLVEVVPFECPSGIIRKKRDIDPLVIECFRKYGLDNVRGGSYWAVDEEKHRATLLKNGVELRPDQMAIPPR